ncbi:hypothetical protein HYX02_01095 [Candidatus Woesearchaeota archaeon]|nr:hypothetical protein [Candidatus Woesearchaeota archaeon]
MTTILGIMDSHLGSACIFKDGVIEAAIAEERLNRIKGYSLFPEKAIKKVMEITGTKGEDIDLVAISNFTFGADVLKLQKKEQGFARNLVANLSRFMPASALDKGFLRQIYIKVTYKMRKSKLFRERARYFQSLDISLDKIRFYEHHDCHAAAAYYMRNWRDNKKTLVFTADGEGDGLCASIWVCEKDRMEKKIPISVMHSLGGMYTRFTKFLGMKPWEHEYKVMGLAPNSNKKRGEDTYQIVKKFMHVDKLKFHNDTNRVGSAFSSYLFKKLKYRQFDNVAYAIQKLQDDIFTKWIRNGINHFGIRNIALAGGSFLNVKTNKLIAEMDCVDNIFIFPPAGDDSCSIGAAILGYLDICEMDGKKPDIKPLMQLYFGESFDDKIQNFVRKINKRKYNIKRYSDVDSVVGELLAKNEIAARCSGRMEYGPRALGNRSILANPSDIDSIERINTIIKYRDFWMPFAPSMLDERAKDYIINPKNLASHYMVMAFDAKEENRKKIIATVHQADKTTRPQILIKDWNEDYYRLIKSFESKTGIGAVLNTSFNLHGEPVVCSPQDAMHTLENSALKHLILGNYLVSKKS